MCDIDYDGANQVESGQWRKAAKQHTCDACSETIRKGDRYHVWRALYDGHWSSMKHCARCWTIVDGLSSADFVPGPVDLHLDCGHTWEEASGEPPPPHIAALAFWLPGDPLEADHG